MAKLLQHTFSSITNLHFCGANSKQKEKNQWTFLDSPPPSKRKMVIFITRISGDPGDLKPRVPPDQIPSVSSSNGRPTCSQNSRALKLADLGGCSPIPPGSESSHGRYTKPRVALSCTSFVNETKHICMRYGTILSWIPSTNSWVIIVFLPGTLSILRCRSSSNTLHHMRPHYNTLHYTILPYATFHIL